jgi:hypothetical protein
VWCWLRPQRRDDRRSTVQRAMRTLRRRVEKLEQENNTSDGPLWRLYVMPAGLQLSEDLAKADEASGYGESAPGSSLIVSEPGNGRLC